MFVLLSAVNAKFIHSSLALYTIASYNKVHGTGDSLLIKEFTINHHHEYIVSEIFRFSPDILCFSCYIWSIQPIKQICRTIKKIMPDINIILGGPEVSFEYKELLEDKICDVVVIGEGEATFSELLHYFASKKGSLRDIDGIAFYENQVITRKKRKSLDLDLIPFPYRDCFEEFKNKIVYYETSRGCPFSCGYCMSSIEANVRWLSLDRVFSELSFFLENKTPLVKFTDRTFNCDKNRTAAIWQFLKENDNGFSVFHFEIAADLLTDELCEILKTARKGLFQFEIGVQSTNQQVLSAIGRKSDLSAIFASVKKLKNFSNINLHLDLIAGLPGEDFGSFKNSFNQVYSLKPDTFQVGFLKLLKGLPLRNNYGIIYDDAPPYTVLRTNDISFAELQILRDMERLIDMYYNSGKTHYTISFCISKFESAFDFYYRFSRYWVENFLYDEAHGRTAIYIILYKFLQIEIPEQVNFISNLLTLDMCKSEKLKTFPYFAKEKGEKNLIRELYVKYVPKGNQKMYHIQCFSYDLIKWVSSGFKDITPKESYILFDYENNTMEGLI